MARVSIIYPMYNVEKYVKDSLKSILNQTYRDFELIAVNDGSKDSTVNIFNDTICGAGDKVNYKLFNKDNGGLADARNFGLKVASGEFVVFIDSDDVIHNRYLETLIRDADKYNADVVVGSYKKVDKEHLFDFSQIVEGQTIKKSKLMRMMLSRRKFDAYCGCFLIKKSVLDTNNILFNKEVKFSVDQAFMWKIIDVSLQLCINYSKIYNYYLRPESIMTSSKLEQICSGEKHFVNTINDLHNLPFNANVVINRWKMGILHSTAKLCNYEQFLQLIQEFNIKFYECTKVPVFNTKVFALVGMFSTKYLYKIFRKY